MPPERETLDALHQELQDALDQQAASAEILRVASRSPGELEPVPAFAIVGLK